MHLLKEGIPAWEAKGYPLFYAGSENEKRIKATIISPADFRAMMDNSPSSFQLVDVREPKEFADGHIPGAVNIPITNFSNIETRLDKGRKIVIYCKIGARSYTAYRRLQRLGFQDVKQVIFDDWIKEGMPVEK